MTSYSKQKGASSIDDGWKIIRNGDEDDVAAEVDTECMADALMELLLNTRPEQRPSPPDYIVDEEYGDRDVQEEEEKEPKRWRATVRETRTYLVRYEVEADYEDEAVAKAEQGETESEETVDLRGVTDRTVLEIEEIKDA